MAVVIDYSRPGRPVSWRGGGFSRHCRARTGALTAFALAFAASVPVAAQYAGKVPEQSKASGPELRAVAVLEWTGDPGHPKASRLVPITIWDSQELQDASIYMAQPEPLALQSDVEYKLKDKGKTIGYYDVQRAGQSQGAALQRLHELFRLGRLECLQTFEQQLDRCELCSQRCPEFV